ncbi:MAG: pseudaminic acid synthase [Xanthobacteraceae bacterium]|nr:pseudaminic acid synthase [Xanthobacteraceae bacterium]
MITANINIAGRHIGPSHPPYVIAEISGNHNGNIERAYAIIDAAKAAGADAVKLQTYTPDTMTINHNGPGFRIDGGPWDGRSLYELYGEAQTPWDWHIKLFDYARKAKIVCFSSPFDETAVDFLEGLGAPAYKIASFEVVDIPLIRYVAKRGKPVIISTGMSSYDELDEAVSAAKESGATGVVLLHCISAYPAPADEANLRRIHTLAERYRCPIGLSDHTLGTAVSTAAVALGAMVIEKHLTLARSDGGLDAGFSLEPAEFKELVGSVKTSFAALGRADYGRAKSEAPNLIFRRSLYVVKDIAAGEALTKENVRSIRPGFGLSPKHFPEIIGRRARKAITRGTPLSLELID